jgi:hypothetical protein
MRRTQANKYKLLLEKKKERLKTRINELTDQRNRGVQSKEGLALLTKLTTELDEIEKNPDTFVPIDTKRRKELSDYLTRLKRIQATRNLSGEEYARLDQYEEELEWVNAGGHRPLGEAHDPIPELPPEVIAKTKRRAERYVPSMSDEQIREIAIEESARKKARFQQLEQGKKTGPKRLELIAAARNQAGVDPVPGLALGNVPGLVGNAATSRLARAAMYNPSGQEAAAFRANQIFPNDSNNLNQGPGPRRSFAQQIPTGLNGQPAYEDASVSNARISPLVQSILVPNYTPPVAPQPAQGRLAQRAWDNYVTDITALGYATRR